MDHDRIDDKDKRIDILSRMPVKKAIWKLSIPTILSMLIHVIYNMTDTFFIGKLNNPDMVAAIAICMPIIFVLAAFGNTFAFGGASLISRLLGRGEQEKAGHTSAISFWSALLLCVGASAVLILLIEPVLVLCGASANTLPYAKEYLLIMLIGGPFLGLQMTMSGLMRSEGATKESMIGLVGGGLINIVLDPIFILHLDMGIKGAALATTIGNLCAFTYYVLYFLRKKSVLSIRPRHFRFQKFYYANIFKVGLPASLENILMSVVLASLNLIAASFGDIVVAGYTIVFRLANIGVMVVMGIAQGCQPMIGYNYGAGNSKRLFDTLKYAIFYATSLCIVFATALYLFAESWISLFIIDPEVVAIGARIMTIHVLSMPLLGTQFILRTLFQSLGRGREAFVLSIGRQGVFFFPALLLFNYFWGFDGFICAKPFADVLATILALVMFALTYKSMKKPGVAALQSSAGG